MSANDAQKHGPTPGEPRSGNSNNAAPHDIQKKQKHPAAQAEKDAREHQEGKPAVLPKKQ